MSKLDKAGKAKTKKHMKVSKKNKIIATLVVVALALLVFCYFAHQTGLPAKILPGAKIVHTVDGKEKKVKSISIVEMNYFFSVTYNEYVSARVIDGSADLDSVYNEQTGQTYREMLWENAANTVQAQYLMLQAAENDETFKPIAADTYAEYKVDSMRSTVDYYNELRGASMTMDQYLQSNFGKGMTVQIFRKIMKRQAIIEEYKEFVKQNRFTPDQATIQTKFDENPLDYTTCQIQAYFVAANVDKDASAEEKEKAMQEAEKTAHQIADDCINAVEFQTKVKMFCDESYRTRMLNGEDPTTVKGLTKERLKTYSEEFAELCFNPETPENTSMVFQDSEGVGYFACLFEKTYLDETVNASFRVIKLDDATLRDISNTLEQKADSHQKLHAEAEGYVASVTSEAQFAELAREHSVDADTILKGGYCGDVTEDNTKYFNPVTVEDGKDPVLPEEDQKLLDWLYSPDRKHGDMIIIDCVASVNIYYFCDSVPAWQSSIRSSSLNDSYNTWYEATVGDTSYSTVINHGLIDFFS